MNKPFAPGTLFSRIFHASPVGMTINSVPDGQYVDVNDSFARLVGFNRSELIGRRAVDLEIISIMRRESVVGDLINKGMLVNAPVQLRHRCGEMREVVVSAQLEKHDGQVYSIAIIQDLTDVMRAQEALHASEARFRLFFESVPLPVLVFDLETLVILDANPAAADTYGYTLAELRGLPLVNLRPPQGRELTRSFIAALGDQTDVGIWQHVKKDGTLMDMAITGYSLQLEGRPVRLAVLRDVTEQRAAERLLVESEQRLQVITELSTDGIWDWNIADQTYQTNEMFRLLYGEPEPDQAATWWLERIHPDDRQTTEQSLMTAVFEGSDSYWSSELRMGRIDSGNYANVIARGYVIRDGDGRPVRMIGALVDITRQIDVAEAATRAALAERQRLARDLHDSVTQSLYSITLLAEVARRRAHAGDAAATLDQITRLGELSQQCLREMRLLVYELRPALVEEAGLVGALRQRLEAVEQRSGVRVQLLADGAAQIPTSVQNELFRVAEEALNNALKHARASSLVVRLDTQDDGVELEIADNGRGFDPDLAAHSGGQGLANMRERVSKLGGDFVIESAPGQQTRVRVRVGLRRPSQWPATTLSIY